MTFFVSRYPKGRLVEVAYEPICRDCSMYFSITASLLDFCFHVSPIASMYGIFTYTFKNQPNVGKYTSPMDCLGHVSHNHFLSSFQKPARDGYVSSASPGLPTAKSLTEIPGIWPRGSGQSRGSPANFRYLRWRYYLISGWGRGNLP